MKPDVTLASVSLRAYRFCIATLLISILGSGSFLATRRARAATNWTVSVGSLGACTVGDPNCASITAAVAAASAGDTISVAAGTYFESNIVINKDLTINGADPATTIVDGQNEGRVFDIVSGTVGITTLSIIHGQTSNGVTSPGGAGAGENGGGIRNAGTLGLNGCIIRDNRTGNGADFSFIPDSSIDSKKPAKVIVIEFLTGGQGGSGGGIYNTGVLTVLNSTISGNQTGNGGSGGGSTTGGAGGDGGGIWNSGSLVVTNSTLAGNRTGDGGPFGLIPTGPRDKSGVDGGSPKIAEGPTGGNGGEGGGIFNGSAGILHLRNSTIALNQTGIGGAGGGLPTSSIDSGGAANGFGSPGIGGNGGGVYTGNVCSTVNPKSSLIANNSVGAGGLGPDFFSDLPINSLGYNLVGQSDSSAGWIATDQTGTIASPLNPLLDPLGLQSNGGLTPTIALQSGSPAVDRGINSFGLVTDQRGPGFARTFDAPVANASSGDGTDTGAFEIQAPPPTPCSPDVTKPVITCPGSVTEYTDSGQLTAQINTGKPVASDNCLLKSVVGARSDGKALNLPYPVGLTLVTWTATDASNNKSTCVQSIVVMQPSTRKVSGGS